MSISYTFAGKRVLITGGAQGIGRTLVQRFHDAGAMVFVIDKDKEAVVKLQNEVPSVIVSIVDLSNWEETRAAVKSFGQIDHLVNNAGIFVPQTFMEVTEGSAMINFSVHVAAVYNVSQVVAQGMIDRGTGGSIINVASIAARAHHASAANYGPVKAAVENLTKSMAVELMPKNIRVNCILPGLVNTGMANQEGVSIELTQRWESIRNCRFGYLSIESLVKYDYWSECCYRWWFDSIVRLCPCMKKLRINNALYIFMSLKMIVVGVFIAYYGIWNYI